MNDGGDPRALIGDIGATNARFALVDAAGDVGHVRVQACEDHPTIEEAIAAYLADERPPQPPRQAALAVASPISGDRVAMTNHPWSFSIAGVKRRFALERFLVINDFTANALALPTLPADKRLAIGGGAPAADMPIAVLGPGTGLGVSGIVPSRGGWVPLTGEGGHVSLAAGDDRESQVIDRLRRRFDHVSAERALSGQGLVNLYQTLGEIAGVRTASLAPAQITDPATGEHDPLARAAYEMFCAMLGSVAGDLALTLGAGGGVYIAGGIVPRLGQRLADTAFRERFEAKGRFRSYLAAIPTYIVMDPVPAFRGLAALLRQTA
jgi:glucokinase